MKRKIFLIALLLSIITAFGAWAQGLPNIPGTATSIWTSPQSATTEGRYRSNADDFIRPDAYAGVKFNKWFGMVSFLWDENYSPVATVGFAARTDNAYIGAFYNGNMWAGAPVNNYTEEEPATVPNGGVAGKIYNVYNPINVVPVPVNNAAILFGVADMGFRFAYRTNYQSFKENNIVTGNQLYNSYQAERGYLAPQIAWAMAKDLTKKGIRPYIAMDFIFDRDYQKIETTGSDTDGCTGEKIIRSSNHFDPSISAGLGGYTFYNKDGFKASFDLDYVLTLNTYENEYSYVEDGVYKTGKFKGTYSPGSNPYNEQSFISNQITPSLSGSWSKDSLALKFKLNMPLTFSGREENLMALDTNNNLVYNGNSNSTNTFAFRPDIRLAMQYKIIPNRLTLNTGARIQATAITLQTTDEIYYNNGEKISSRKVHKDSFGGSFVNRFSIGPTLNFTENVWVEATTGVTNAYGNEGTIDVFAPGSLFSFGSILLVLKF